MAICSAEGTEVQCAGGCFVLVMFGAEPATFCGDEVTFTPPVFKAARSDVVFTCVPSSVEVEKLVFGADGLLCAAHAGLIHVDSTTAELMVENVAMLNRQHLIVFATLRDPVLKALAEGMPENLSDVARAVSAAEMLHERRLVLERLARIGVLCVEAEQQALTGRLLSTYFTIKAREMV